MASDTELLVLCFDRDHTVSINAHPERAAVPIGYVQYLTYDTDISVWETGNQHLTNEAAIPSLAEAEELWEDDPGNDSYEYTDSEFQNHLTPQRRDGLRLILDLYEAVFPDKTFRFIVVDDVDVSDLTAEGQWTYYFPWDFVAVMEAGVLQRSRRLMEPPDVAYRNEGVSFNSTSDPYFDFQQRTVAEVKQ